MFRIQSDVKLAADCPTLTSLPLACKQDMIYPYGAAETEAMRQMKRNTRQREAIRRAFRNNSHPMVPLEVLKAAQRYEPRVGIATVYRTLKALCKEGWLVPFDLPGEKVTYYERTQSHHHHFVCRSCQRLYKVDCLAENFRKLIPKGFVLENHEFLLYGVCAPCRTTESPARRSKTIPNPRQ